MADDDIIGIDLGTTNSLVGAVDAGFPILFANEQGNRITPSVVHYPEKGEIVVGSAALRGRSLHPERTITSVKRLMGRREISPEEAGIFACPVAASPNGLQLTIGGEKPLLPKTSPRRSFANLRPSPRVAWSQK
jgi:molecular chaperone DnaK (HSP70)